MAVGARSRGRVLRWNRSRVRPARRVMLAQGSVPAPTPSACDATSARGRGDRAPSVRGPMTRICITGGPRTGKTTLATDLWEEDDLPHGIVRHTDDLIGLHDWSGASQVASEWL